MTTAIQVVTTTDSEAAAAEIARRLVERRLAACVQIVGPVASVYRWQGQVQAEGEFRLLLKTTSDRYPALELALRAAHPYELPAIVALPCSAVSTQFADWVRAEVQPPP